MAAKIGISTSTLDREIARMSEWISHIGPKKGGHWEIIPDNDTNSSNYK